MANEADVRWTAKLPTLAIGIVLVIAAVIASSRRATIAAIILLLSGVAFVGYSLTIKDWCEVKGLAWGQLGYGQHAFGACWKQKGWLSF